MEEQTTNAPVANKSGMKTGVVVALVIVAAVIFGGFGYVFGQRAEQKKTKETASATATATASKVSSAIVSATASATDETASWKTYTNTKYGFTLTLTDKWKGYKVKSFAASPMTEVNYINVPTTDNNYQRELETSYSGYAAPVSIDVFTKEQWNKYIADTPSIATKLGENSNYVFAYTTWQDAPSDLRVSGLADEVASVAQSFKLLD